jgi:hypothetical protein
VRGDERVAITVLTSTYHLRLCYSYLMVIVYTYKQFKLLNLTNSKQCVLMVLNISTSPHFKNKTER